MNHCKCGATDQLAFTTDRTGLAQWLCRTCEAVETAHVVIIQTGPNVFGSAAWFRHRAVLLAQHVIKQTENTQTEDTQLLREVVRQRDQLLHDNTNLERGVRELAEVACSRMSIDNAVSQITVLKASLREACALADELSVLDNGVSHDARKLAIGHRLDELLKFAEASC